MSMTATPISAKAAGATPSQSVVAQVAPPKKRERTFGEIAFDWGAYGGVAMIGNELTSQQVTSYLTEGRGLAGYTKFKDFFTNLKDTPYVPKYASSGRMPYVMAACIGGMAMVLPVKWLEDHKGNIVRKLDHWRHGTKAETDPHYIAAHEEMDRTPKQSWGSLGKGRIITVISALVGDSIFGWEHGITARLAKGTKLERFSSLDHISNEVGHGLVKAFKIPEPQQAAKFKLFQNLTWLFTLSTTLTVLFYASSKLFASDRDKHKEQKREANAARGNSGGDAKDEADIPLDSATVPEKADTPRATVNQVERQNLLASAPELAHHLN